MVDDETYNAACVRAELLGLAPPNKEEFEKARAERLERAAEEQEAAEATMLDTQEEGMKNVGGRLDELNTILSSTQKKINRLKDSARGSITGLFNRGSVDNPDAGTSSGSGSRRNTNTSTGDIGLVDNTKQQQEEEGETNEDDNEIKPVISTEKIRQAKLDIQKKMSSHLDKLDMLVNKAEHADIAMSEQTKQMRKMAE